MAATRFASAAHTKATEAARCAVGPRAGDPTAGHQHLATAIILAPPAFTLFTGQTAQVTIAVRYADSGACLGAPGHAILPPINADGSSVFKQGSTVPAKFRVCDANGNSIGTPGVVADFKLVQVTAGTVQTVKVSVLPVPGESTTDNNESSYPVQFEK